MEIILSNTSTIEGKKVVKTLGLVRGNTVRSKWFGKDIIAGFRSLVGGELKEYTEMMTEAREEALKRMIKEAERLGANAVVNVRFATSNIMSTASELMAYGTAVIVK